MTHADAASLLAHTYPGSSVGLEHIQWFQKIGGYNTMNAGRRLSPPGSATCSRPDASSPPTGGYAGVFDAGYDPGPQAYALGAFWPTFVLSALIVMGNPISAGAFLGDWSRYIPAATPVRSLLLATLFAQLATLVPFLFGVATATVVTGEADYVFALVQASPLWYAVLLMVVAFLGGLSTGVTSLYGTGLDL